VLIHDWRAWFRTFVLRRRPPVTRARWHRIDGVSQRALEPDDLVRERERRPRWIDRRETWRRHDG
jgi:hypothetical protein